MQTKSEKISILGLPLETLKKEFVDNGFSILDAKRVFPWIHPKLASSFDDMSDVPKQRRAILPDFFSLKRPECKILQQSLDGTAKALLEFDDKNCAETVFIPEEKRNTVCASSQIGCPIGCVFCNTGTQRFRRNLTSAEIMSQIMYWIERQKKSNSTPITNIVFMGMGEPLLNSQNLFAVLEILLSKKTYNFARDKITVSTSGIINGSLAALAKFGVKLAVSLHAPNDEKRSSLMPINKKYQIPEILSAAKNYLELSNTSHITFEYLLLDGVNDSNNDALELANLLKHFRSRCRVNLILFNPWNGSKFKGVSGNKANNFSRILLSHGIRAIIRKSRGRDIMAACGQLKSDNNLK